MRTYLCDTKPFTTLLSWTHLSDPSLVPLLRLLEPLVHLLGLVEQLDERQHRAEDRRGLAAREAGQGERERER